jgi:hypothetical protein
LPLVRVQGRLALLEQVTSMCDRAGHGSRLADR